MHLVRDWMEVAKKLVNRETQEELYVQIVDHLAFATAKIGNSHGAYRHNLELTDLRPENSRYRGNTLHYK